MNYTPGTDTTDSVNADTRRKVILAGLVGNIMEWFDFAVYGYFASIIGTHFFPSENPAISLIAAFGDGYGSANGTDRVDAYLSDHRCCCPHTARIVAHNPGTFGRW